MPLSPGLGYARAAAPDEGEDIGGADNIDVDRAMSRPIAHAGVGYVDGSRAAFGYGEVFDVSVFHPDNAVADARGAVFTLALQLLCRQRARPPVRGARVHQAAARASTRPQRARPPGRSARVRQSAARASASPQRARPPVRGAFS